MTNEEVVEALDLSVTTVKTYWTFARGWLFDAIRNSYCKRQRVFPQGFRYWTFARTWLLQEIKGS